MVRLCLSRRRIGHMSARSESDSPPVCNQERIEKVAKNKTNLTKKAQMESCQPQKRPNQRTTQCWLSFSFLSRNIFTFHWKKHGDESIICRKKRKKIYENDIQRTMSSKTSIFGSESRATKIEGGKSIEKEASKTWLWTKWKEKREIFVVSYVPIPLWSLGENGSAEKKIAQNNR